MLVVSGSVEMVDFVLVVDGPEVVVRAVAGKDEVGNIAVVTGDELNDSVGVVAEVIAGDVGGAFLIAAKKKVLLNKHLSIDIHSTYSMN